jgi:UPF0716 family protein affecting phage T7 exclusion
MDAGIARLIVAGIIGAHGIGHVLGWLPALGVVRFEGTAVDSWLISGVAGDGGSRLVAAVLFLVPTVGFVAAAIGLLTGQPWWRQAAVGSAAVSLAGTALYPHAFPAGSTVGSVVVNVAILGGVLVLGWGADGASI